MKVPDFIWTAKVIIKAKMRNVYFKAYLAEK